MALGIYAAFPPEVNVGRLLFGSGAGPMFAAAAGYTGIAQAATTLASTSDAQVQSLMTTWRGEAADRATPAFQRLSAWLRELAALAEATAAQATSVANAYLTALATSPTIPELVMNRTTLTTLIATNIFGINTVPIGATEADYMRMWMQAAGAMGTYDAAAASNTPMTALQQAPAIVSQLMGPLSSLTGQFSSLASNAQQDKQFQDEGRPNTHPGSELLSSLPAGFLDTTPGSSVLGELRGENAGVPPPILTRGGLNDMSGERTGFVLPAKGVPGTVAGEQAGTRPGTPGANGPGAAPMGAAPMAGAPMGARPGAQEMVSVADRHQEEVPPSTAVAVIDPGDDEEEVPASVET